MTLVTTNSNLPTIKVTATDTDDLDNDIVENIMSQSLYLGETMDNDSVYLYKDWVIKVHVKQENKK